MRDLYNEQLGRLDDMLVRMGSMCKESISLAVRCMTEEDERLSDQVETMDDGIDRMERDIETLCLKLLLRQQPVAADLRKVSAALKMITDLERIGDQAFVIAEIANYLRGRIDSASQPLFAMAAGAQEMLEGSIASFVNGDADLARKVIDSDDVLDSLFDRTKDQLVKMIAQDHVDGEYALDVLMVAKCLERIGDHACNVAEWVEYSIEGTRD